MCVCAPVRLWTRTSVESASGSAVVDVVTHRQQIRHAELMIDAPDEDVAVQRRVAVADVVVRVGGRPLAVRQRVVLQRRACDRIDPIRGDDVAVERLPRDRVVDDDRHAGVAPEIREITRAVPQGRHGREHGLARQLSRPLPRSEEERPAPPNRAAKRSAELVQADGRLRRGEDILRVERVVAERFERGAVEVVAARARGHDDHAAGGVAELRGVVVRDDLEFLHRVDGERGQLLRAGQADGVRRVAAVEDEVLVARAAAGDGKDRIVLGGAGAGVDHDDARRQRHER
jgi:hypothetical protein